MHALESCNSSSQRPSKAVTAFWTSLQQAAEVSPFSSQSLQSHCLETELRQTNEMSQIKIFHTCIGLKCDSVETRHVLVCAYVPEGSTEKCVTLGATAYRNWASTSGKGRWVVFAP